MAACTCGATKVLHWIAFNQSYNALFAARALTFEVDSATTQTARLYAVITGHGNDNHGCGEFCATEHTFRFDGGAPITKQQLLPATNQQLGCAEEVDLGVTPNEYGTWLYGRDGWCNGRPVLPWVVDVSEQVIANRTSGTRSVTLEYTASWCSSPGVCAPADPGPPSTWQQAPPVMMLAIYVVLGVAPPPETPWWGLQGVQLGGLGVAAVAAVGAIGRWSGQRLMSRQAQRVRLGAALLAEHGYRGRGDA